MNVFHSQLQKPPETSHRATAQRSETASSKIAQRERAAACHARAAGANPFSQLLLRRVLPNGFQKR
jgi:hypothetical protein